MCACERKKKVKMGKAEAGTMQTGCQCGSKYKGGLWMSVGYADTQGWVHKGGIQDTDH